MQEISGEAMRKRLDEVDKAGALADAASLGNRAERRGVDRAKPKVVGFPKPVTFCEDCGHEDDSAELMAVPDLSLLAISEEQAAALIGKATGDVAAQQAKLAEELMATPLSRAYWRLRQAKTPKELGRARAKVRRAARQQMANTMMANNETLRRSPRIARAVAAAVVRNTMATAASPIGAADKAVR